MLNIVGGVNFAEKKEFRSSGVSEVQTIVFSLSIAIRSLRTLTTLTTLNNSFQYRIRDYISPYYDWWELHNLYYN